VRHTPETRCCPAAAPLQCLLALSFSAGLSHERAQGIPGRNCIGFWGTACAPLVGLAPSVRPARDEEGSPGDEEAS
jgi:hypothetical protein